MKETIGKRIKILREHKGVSQQELADSLNISRSAFERMENGKSNSWATHLEQLSVYFNVVPEYFVQNEEYDFQVNNTQYKGLPLQITREIKILTETLTAKIIEMYDSELKEKEEIITLLKNNSKNS